MRGRGFAAVAVFLSAVSLHAQTTVSVRESEIRAVLKNGSTVVLLPVEARSDRVLQARVRLDWLSTLGDPLETTLRESVLNPGSAVLELPLPLPRSDIWLRLKYSVDPISPGPNAFAPQNGVVAISQVAAHVFELKLGSVGSAQAGSRHVVRAQAVHPGTRTPVGGVEWSARLHVNDAQVPPARISPVEDGFVELEFELPKVPRDGSEPRASVDVTGRSGDFEQSESVDVLFVNRRSASIQTDKPIYQPGQAIHMRALTFDADGRAAEGSKVHLRIEGPEGDRVHTAELVSSRFGVAQDTWTLPEGSALGSYRIIVAEEDGVYQLANHVVRVSRYELPAFSVSATPSQGAYFPQDSPSVEIRGTYGFGKPVPLAKVKVVRSRHGDWNAQARKYDPNDEVVAEGVADAAGVFRASFGFGDDWGDLNDDTRFEDLHYAAYLTDPSSDRTEQKRFDLRVTHQPIHIYLVRPDAPEKLPAPVFAATYYADGRPAETTVELSLEGQRVTVRTNRYGVAKAMLARGSDDSRDDIVARAVDATGVTGEWREEVWVRPAAVLLQTERTIYRAGEPVAVTLTAPSGPRYFWVDAIANDRVVASLVAHVVNGTARVVFPYRPEFKGTVIFAAWNNADSAVDYRRSAAVARTVLFPGDAAL